MKRHLLMLLRNRKLYFDILEASILLEMLVFPFDSFYFILFYINFIHKKRLFIQSKEWHSPSTQEVYSRYTHD